MKHQIFIKSGSAMYFYKMRKGGMKYNLKIVSYICKKINKLIKRESF